MKRHAVGGAGLFFLLFFAMEGPSQERRVDAYGDPLPEGASARLGTVRLRNAGGVGDVEFSRDGTRIFSTGQDGVRIWDAATGVPLGMAPDTGGQFFGRLAYSPDGARLAGLAFEEGEIRVWDPETWNVLLNIKCPKGSHSLTYLPDGAAFATASQDAVHLWDATTGAELRKLPVGQDQYRYHPIAISPDSALLAAAAQTKIYLWRLKSNDPPKIIDNAHGEKTYAVCFTHDGKLISAGSAEYRSVQLAGDDVLTAGGEIHVWDPAKGERLAEFPQIDPGGPASSLAITIDGKQLIAAYHMKLCLWDLAERKLLRSESFINPGGIAGPIALSPDGRTAAMGEEHRLRIWDVASGAQRLTFEGSPIDHTRAGAWSPDGRSVAVAAANSGITCWDAASGRHQKTFLLGGERRGIPTSVAFSSDGQRLAAAGYRPGFQGYATVWDLATGDIASAWTTFRTSGVRATAALTMDFSRDLELFAMNDRVAVDPFGGGPPGPGRVVVWNARVGREADRLPQSEQVPQLLRFSDDGSRLAVMRGDRVLLWNLQDGSILEQIRPGALRNHQGDRAEFSPALDRLVVNSYRGAVIAIDLHDGKTLQTWSLAGAQGGPVAFSSDGKLLAYGTLRLLPQEPRAKREHVIYVWDVESGRELHVFKPAEAGVTSLAFSPDDSRLLSTLDSGSSLVWEIRLPNK